MHAKSVPSEPRVGAALLCAAMVMTCAGWYGCDSSGSGIRGASVAPRQHPMLEGIPLPSDVRTVRERTVGRATGAVRMGQYEFECGLAPIEVRSFFLENMPGAHFTKKEEHTENGAYTMRFESNTEVCSICAKPKPWSSKTALIVDIGPLSKGGAESPPRPAGDTP